jgi:hypothetical protein
VSTSAKGAYARSARDQASASASAKKASVWSTENHKPTALYVLMQVCSRRGERHFRNMSGRSTQRRSWSRQWHNNTRFFQLKEHIQKRQDDGTGFLALTLELAGKPAVRHNNNEQQQSPSEKILVETLACKYNRVLSQSIEKTLLAGVLVVLVEVMPLHFHGDATPDGHRLV